MSGTPSELATSEMPVSEPGDGEETPAPKVATFPPYPPYATEPAPPSVADTIIAGHDLRLQHKSIPRKPIRPPPKPARPRGPKATDVKMSQRALRAHARCLRKHGTILTDRLERMSKPLRRNIIYLWREHAYTLPPETIARLRAMLDADEPFKPDQAYEYFINLKKTKKKAVATERVKEIQKDMLAMCGEKRFLWARNATVAFARGIQQRLSRPGRYSLADGMLRLSDIILDEICGYMHMRTPSRRCTHPKAKFMMEMADKVAVWIDEILSESDDRMLMMDFDEDDDIYGHHKGDGGDDSFTDDFLDMMGDDQPRGLLPARPAHTKFDGNMKKAFEILTDAMDSNGDGKLVSHGKFHQTFSEGADMLRRAKNLKATEYSMKVADKINKKLTGLTKDITPHKVSRAMKDMVDICSNYLAQNAEFNKKKGPAYKILVNAMKNKNNDTMYQKGKVQRTYAQAAEDLDQAPGLDADHDDPNLSQEIHSAMSRLVKAVTPDEMKKEMAETVDACSKYLSQKAVDENERGPAFNFLIKQLDKHGGEPFSEYPALATKNAAAYTLKSAPGLASVPPDPATANVFKNALHKAIDAATPKEMAEEMKDVIDSCGDYLSAFIRDRGPAMDALLDMMKKNPKNVFASRNDYTMDYETAAEETENAPLLIPHLPVKDIADEGKANLTKDMKDVTPPELKVPMKTLIKDVSKYLSQPVAMRSGAAGDRYPMNFLAAVKKSLGTKPLYKYKSYGQSYADAADVLEHAGPIDSIVNLASGMSLHSQQQLKSAMNLMSQQKLGSKPELTSQEELPFSTIDLGHEIASEMKRGVPTQLAPTIAEGLHPTMDKAAKHLAKHGAGKGKAMEYVVDRMKEKGEEKLGQLQGYDQTYKDGARRLENTPTLANEKVDKSTYDTVKNKLADITKDKPNEKFAEHIPGIVEDSAKFLSAPVPKTEAEKRQVLGDLMARQEDKILGGDGAYKMTYTEGGEQIKNAPVGVTKAHDEKKNKEMAKKLEAVVPDKKMAALLKQSTKEGAAHLTDVIKGRGEAMEVIQESLKKEKDKEFIDVGEFKKTHEQVGGMLTEAPNLKSEKPSPVILEKVEHQMSVLPKDVPDNKPMAKEHMEDASKIAAKYIATQATKESGLDAQQLAALDEAGFNADAKAAAEERRLAAVEAGPGGNKTAAAGATAEQEEEEGGSPGAKRKRARKKGATGAAEVDGVAEAEEDDIDAKKGGGRAKRKRVGGIGGTDEAGAESAGAKAAGGEVGADGRSPKAAGAGGTRTVFGSVGPDGTTVGPDGTIYAPDGTVKKGPGGAMPGQDAAAQPSDSAGYDLLGWFGLGGKTQEPDGAGQGPCGAGQGPAGAEQGTGRAGKGPDGAVQGPGGVVQGPGGVVQGPGGIVQGPGGIVQSPGGVIQGPGGVVQGPGGVVQGPGGVVQGPGGVVQGPGGLVQAPGGIIQGPGGVVQGPGGVVQGPGGASYVPGAAGQGPGGEAYVPGVAGQVPGGAGQGPGGVVYGPDGTGYGTDGTVYHPDGTVHGPDGTVYGPDGAVSGPGGAGQAPGVATHGAAGGRQRPGGAAPGLAASAEYGPAGAAQIAGSPGAPIIGPDGTTYAPGVAVYGPGGTTDKTGAAYFYDYGPEGAPDYGPGGETEEQRRRRLAEAEAFRKYEEAERRRLGDKEYFRQQAERFKRQQETGGSGKYRGGALGADYDSEHETALDILHRELQALGPEIFYQQPQATLTHGQASDWLSSPFPIRVDKAVRDASDTARLHKKFEKKLSAIVSAVTPPELYDCMQDVVIEGARRLSEFFVSTSYNAVVNDALISEMQKRGNEILTEVDGAAETYFFASQRLKKADTLDVQEPCYKVAHDLTKKLDNVVRTRPMARKLNMKMKDHIKETSNFLSAVVTKPDEQIEAYIALLEEMEAAGDNVLIDGDIPKTYKEASDYLRQLTSFEDHISRPNAALQTVIQNRLTNLMSEVPPSEARYSQEVMDSVIAESAGLLTSYVMLHAEKTDALKVLVEEIQKEGEGALLRHGPIRKSFKQGADLLRGKTTDQLSVHAADPVVARKIQIKLHNIMKNKTPMKHRELMDEVIEDTTMYLADHLLHPNVIQVCKCYKNVFVQCELWCDEILRRVARPCCSCSRHVSAQALQDLAPTQRLRVSPSCSRVFAPGVQISFTTCPKQVPTPQGDTPNVCPASKPTAGCCAPQGPTTSYLMYSTSHNFGYDSMRLSSAGSSSSSHLTSISSKSPIQLSKLSSPLKTLLQDIHSDNMQLFQQQPQEEGVEFYETKKQNPLEEFPPSYFSSCSNYNLDTTQQQPASSQSFQQNHSMATIHSAPASETSKITQAKSGYSSRTPIISTDQMADWHAMMVSLMWNLQAWRDWIQEIVDHALAYQHNPNIAREENTDTWSSFHRRISKEALQWRQYSVFSRQLTTRLHSRYKDKEIVSPTRATVKTKTYIECQEEMLEIIEMFNRWTQWLTLVVKETDSMEQGSASNVSLHQMRWNHLKKKIEGYSKDWVKYNMFLKVSWEQKYSAVIADYLPSWKKPGPVWVVSACGAVPSGAVAAGVFDGEVIWVARTTHRCKVLPAALYPSKHSCLVYAEGAAHRYTKYQVMCNAEVRWVAWRGGSIGGRAVRVAAGVHIGRVHYRGDHLLGAVHEPHYRCHVVIFGRPFAFNCYELLMLADNGDEEQLPN